MDIFKMDNAGGKHEDMQVRSNRNRHRTTADYAKDKDDAVQSGKATIGANRIYISHPGAAGVADVE
ncbi:MAG: hypothetical protein SWH61_09460 [Thermodesulfobacteriota bacterium]|nr:hypothetical protein [Thermodesulfobacteriota bacterium]